MQIMHLGSFDDELESVAKMDAFLRENGYENDLNDVRLHHEIYLSDPRRVAAEKRKTVLRDRKSTRLNSSHQVRSRMPSSA